MIFNSNNISKWLFNFSIIIFACSITSAQNLTEEIESHSSLSSAHIGYCFYNISKGEELDAYQANKLFIPASVLKIISTAYTLDILKAGYKFSTEVLYNGEVIKDTLHGNLIVKPSFDPSLGFENFSELILESLKNNKIKVVKGSIVFDKENLVLSELPQSWLFEDIANYYGSKAHPFNFDENIYTITFRQSSEGSLCSIESISPKVNLVFDNQVKAGPGNSGDNAFILGAPFSKERQIVGTIPSGNDRFSIKGAVANPEELFKELLITYFEDEGVLLLNDTVVNSENEEKLITFYSNTLEDLLKTTNQKSNNLYAEALLMAVANKQRSSSYQEVLENLDLWLQYQNLSTQNISILDACGLSRLNALSPSFLVDFLIKMNSNDIFKKSLAVSGESGTLKYFTSAQLRGNLHGKSGSSRGILNYVGYFKNASGDTIAFAIMINQHNSKNSVLRRLLIPLIEQYY